MTIDSEETTTPARTWPITVQLKTPIEFGSKTITELTFRQGRMSDLKGIVLDGKSIPMDALLALASRMSGQPSAVIDRIDGDDVGEVLALALDFFGTSLGGGNKP